MQRNADMKKGSATKVDRPLALQKRLFDISKQKQLCVVHICGLACIQAHAVLDSGNKELSPRWVKNLLFPFT
jgi:thiamine monophosphate synthase